MRRSREILKIKLLFSYQKNNKESGYIERKDNKLVIYPTKIKNDRG